MKSAVKKKKKKKSTLGFMDLYMTIVFLSQMEITGSPNPLLGVYIVTGHSAGKEEARQTP